MFTRLVIPVALLLLGMALVAEFAPAAEPDVPPVTVVKDVRPNETAFEKSSVRKPLVLESAAAAADYFDAEALAKLRKQVDFDTQIVLVFAWRGSGQDELVHAVGESFPEQVFYRYQPGRTRDLRPHSVVHALRANVTWKTK